MSKTYQTRGAAPPLNHAVYDKYLDTLGINNSDEAHLRSRGLDHRTIHRAGYASKPHNTSGQANKAIAKVENEFNLDGVPGFYIDDKGNRNQMGTYGIAIPVRDVDGHINQLIIRSQKPKKAKDGRPINKYIAFSSAKGAKGAKVWQIIHHPIVRGKPRDAAGVEIRATEGILKADVATFLDEKYYCIGLQGLKITDDFENTLSELEVSVLRIALDAGEDENKDMIRAKAALYHRAKEFGCDVVFETWDPKYGKGIDDVLKAGHGDKIKTLSDDEVDHLLETANEKDPNNGDWVFCIELERFININTFKELKVSQFAYKFHFKSVNDVSSFLSMGFPQVDKLTFDPEGELYTMRDGEHCLNAYRRPPLVATQGDVTPFLDHLEYLFPGDEIAQKMVLDFMAHTIQFPGVKILWMLVIVSEEEGIGKSFFGEVMKRLLGNWNVSMPSNESLHEKYNGWAKNVLLVVIEELMARGRLDLMNKLKPLITQPEINIREMHANAYDAPNCFNLMAFTNYIDALKIGKKDRRYGVIQSHAKPRDKEYYIPLWDWMRKPSSLSNLYHFFLNYDLKDFNPNERPPMTSAKSEMIESGLSFAEEWVINCIENSVWPFQGDIVTPRHLINLKNIPNNANRVTEKKMAQILKEAGAAQYPSQVTFSDKSRARPWIVRRQNHWLKAGSELLVKNYEKYSLDVEPGGANPLEEAEPL